MSTGGDKRRYPRRKPFASQPELTLRATINDEPIRVFGKLVDVGRGGLSLEIPRSLEVGSVANVSGAIEDLRGREEIDHKCRVRFCRSAGNGKFIVGLAYDTGDPAHATVATDHYDVLQLSRNADFDTIQRVFRILAQRYHPDNQDTGNAATFQQIVEAHRVLSDPDLRAAWDLQSRGQTASRFKLFQSWQDTQGPEAERRIRRGILTILYRQRQTNPRNPEVSLMDLAEALDVPREHLEFSLWFLRESKSIKSGDSGRLEITLSGVLATEAEEREARAATPEPAAIEAAPRQAATRN